MDSLSLRFNVIEQRLARLEQTVALQQRYDRIFKKIENLETLLNDKDKKSVAHHQREEVLEFTPTPGASETQHKLEAKLFYQKITSFKFVRAPPDYYEQSFEFRKGIVGADSIHQLCKSMIMENTRAHPSVNNWSNPSNSKYYVVIVQYTARLHGEKLRAAVARMNAGISRQYFNFRLAPEEVSDEMSGFTHNAVTPVGIRTRLPIILSHEIAALQHAEDGAMDFFWLGGGEVDLKLGLRVSEFIEKFHPIIVDCTY